MSSLGLIVALPEMVLLAAASIVLVVDLFVSDERRNVTYGMTMLALLAVAVAVCLSLARNEVVVGFGGMYIADPMGHVLKLFAIFCCGFMLICAQSYARARGIWKGELFSLTLFTLLGIMLMISANNLLVIYLGLELQALSMYALVALRRDDPRASEAAMKYFVLGSLASGFLLYGMSMLYGATGTLEIDELARRVAGGQIVSRASLLLGIVFVIAGLAFKFGVVPFHMWAPDVYQGAPTPITLLISSAPELAIFAIAFRILVEGLLPLAIDWQKILALLAVASLVLGNLTAIAQTNLKRMLAYSTIAQMGFVLLAMLSGVAAGDPASIASCVQRGDVLSDHLCADLARHVRRHAAAVEAGIRSRRDCGLSRAGQAQPVVRVRDAAADVFAGGRSADGGLLREAGGAAGVVKRRRNRRGGFIGRDRGVLFADRGVLLPAHRQDDVLRRADARSRRRFRSLRRPTCAWRCRSTACWCWSSAFFRNICCSCARTR